MMEAELMRVLQFAKRSVVTVALVSATLTGCGDSISDAPFNPAGTNTDLAAMTATFASPTFASFSTFSLLFDGALGGTPIVSASAAALDIRTKQGTPEALRAAAARSAQRLAGIMKRPAGSGASMMTIPAGAQGKTFVYDPGTGAYVVSTTATPLANNKVRFLLYEVDETFTPRIPLIDLGYVELTDLSVGTTQAAKVQVVAGGTVYIDYTVSVTTSASSGTVNVIGYATDGITRANLNVRSRVTFVAGLTLTYSLDLPDRDVSIDLTVNISDLSSPTSPVVITMVMRGPNGTVAMNGQFTDTSGILHVQISGDPFATITTDGATATIARDDGTPLTDDEFTALNGVFDLQAGAFIAFDQMLAPVGTLLGG
jgi:hypothetical protein